MGGRRGGSGSRARSKLRRKRDRRAQKDARQAQYERWRDLGINQKSKRAVKGRRRGPRARLHATMCGNPGCVRCCGLSFKPFMKDGKPHNMPPWMWKLWTWRKENLQALARAEL